MENRKRFFAGRRGAVLAAVSVILMCAALFAGCRKNTGDIDNEQDSITATATPQPTATPTPTPMPTPTPIPFVQRTYETFGRDDVYLVPTDPPEGDSNRSRIATKCAGEFVLNWYSIWDEADIVESTNYMVLFAPAVTDERYTLKPDFPLNQPELLSDGTVVLTGWEKGEVHVYDKTLTELTSFIPGGEGEKVPQTIGVSDDGTIWVTFEKEAKLYAFDLTGEPKGEYEYDDSVVATMYLCRQGDKDCFYTVTTGETYESGSLYLSTETGEIEYRSRNIEDLGYAWNRNAATPTQGWNLSSSDSTWFFHGADSGSTLTFPKTDAGESMTFIDGKKLCSCVSRWNDDFEGTYEYRIYDLDKQTVSEVLEKADIPGCSYLSAYGVLPDGYVVMISVDDDGGESMLLWEPGPDFTRIDGFCDLAEVDPAEYAAQRIEALKDNFGIEITPDAYTDGEEELSIGDAMSEIELINAFMLYAKQDPEVLKTASGEPLHPENMYTNDGAHYEFNPHVFSKYYLKEHGEERRDAFFRYVDALRAGEDSFECPNTGAANWSSGRLAKYFFPIGSAYCYADYTGDGRATITYMIPKEEFLEKEREFERMVTAIINDVVEEDYTDFEKTLALYEFMTEYCVYDYEMLEHNGEEEWNAKQSGYRVLVEKQGICWEIACLYRYLLLQCGVDAEETTGFPLNPEDDLHEWNYIEFDGVGYLIDATWGLTTNRAPDLTYFLFTDALRRDRDGFDPESFDLGGNGLYGARKTYGFKAEDERYSALWDGRYVAFDENEKCIFYKDFSGKLKRFDYGDLSEVTE